VVVERLTLPEPSLRTRGAQLLDVMEIQYVAQVQSDEDVARIVDSSAQRSAPGALESIHHQPLQHLNPTIIHLLLIRILCQEYLLRSGTAEWASG